MNNQTLADLEAENPNPIINTNQNGRNFFFLKLVGAALGLMAFGTITVSVALALTDPIKDKEELEEQYAEKLTVKNYLAGEYNKANKELCLVEVSLSKKKLELHHSEREILPPEDYARVANKAQNDCEPQGEAPGLEASQQ